MYYLSRKIFNLPDGATLYLDDDNDRVLFPWYNNYISAKFNDERSDEEIASLLLKRLYNVDVDPEKLVIGSRESIEGLLSSVGDISGLGPVYNLRNEIGVDCEIVVPLNSKITELLNRRYGYDTSILKSLIDENLDIVAQTYLNSLLKSRWEAINSLGDENVMNNGGSYLYYRNWKIKNIATKPIDDSISQINMLCTTVEFEQMLNSWKENLAKSKKLQI